MAKLSHIDDFNNDNLDEAMRKAAAQTRQTLNKKQAVANTQNAESSSAQKANAQVANAKHMRSAGKKEQENKEEEDFDDVDAGPMSAGQKVIIVIAFIALAAVIGYFLNYWFHFV